MKYVQKGRGSQRMRWEKRARRRDESVSMRVYDVCIRGLIYRDGLKKIERI